MENSAIEWTTHTFNPWMGCTKVSPGCKFCYAETLMDTRYGKVEWGPQGRRVRTSDANWRKPLAWNRAAEFARKRAQVFCASLADVFEVKVDQAAAMTGWRAELWDLIGQTPWLDWLLLTKRPEFVGRMVPPEWMTSYWPANVWIGTSVENQEYAEKRIPELLKVPAAVRFLSCEPLLGPVDLTAAGAIYNGEYPGVNWVIVGGESGPNARPMHADWARGLRDQCQEAGVPFFFKQWGEWALADYEDLPNVWLGDNGNIVERSNPYPECPPFNAAVMKRVGKKRAGRLLDGREWNELPVTESVAG